MWCLAVTLAALASSALPARGVAGFGDVDDGRYYTTPVQWLVDTGLTTGIDPTCFAPDGHLTRGEAAVFLHRLAGTPPAAAPLPFVDVTAAWQTEAVAWLAAAGITTGVDPTHYAPQRLVTRGELAALIHRFAGSPPSPATPLPFVDVVRPWQVTPVAWMFATGITTGTSASTFSPDLVVTRGQMATFLYRFAGTPPTAVDPSSPACDRRTARRVTTTGFAPYGRAGELELHAPADRVELVGFHQANHDGAVDQVLVPGEVPVTILADRGRGTGPRTAADIVVDPDVEIRAPVTGTVIRGGGYTLYCRYRDEFVVIRPDGHPDWEVKVLHFDGLQVAPGDRVVAGVTTIGLHAADLPFVSQVDAVSSSPSWPHVHVEVVDTTIPDRPSGRSC